MDFWERVARLLAEKWYADADPFDETIAPHAENFEDLVEWAATAIEVEDEKAVN
jgi:hypothetical protein